MKRIIDVLEEGKITEPVVAGFLRIKERHAAKIAEPRVAGFLRIKEIRR